MANEEALSAEDKKWRARSDANNLSEAEVIKQDPQRLKAAAEAAKEMADDQMKEAVAMSKIADWPLDYSKSLPDDKK